MRSSSRRGRGGGEDIAEGSGKGRRWIFVNTIAAVLGIKLHDRVQDWTSAHIVMALWDREKHGIGFVYTVGVSGTTTTCTCLGFTNNGIHDSTPSLSIEVSRC